MKKVLKTLLISLLAICMILPIVACDNSSSSDSTPGLKYKKIHGVYTIVDYVQEEGVTELNIGEKLPENVTNVRIKKGTFAGNATLTKVIVSDKITLIDAGAFEKMGKLSSIELPFIGKTANSDATLSETQKGTEEYNKAVNSERTIAHIFGTEEYDAGVSITINYDNTNTVTCYVPLTLKEVIVNATKDYSIPMYAFNGAVNLNSIKLLGKIDQIGEYAFVGVKEMTEISIPSTVKKIRVGAFMECSKLATVTFAEGISLEKIEKNAFALTKVKADDVKKVYTMTDDQVKDIFGE